MSFRSVLRIRPLATFAIPFVLVFCGGPDLEEAAAQIIQRRPTTIAPPNDRMQQFPGPQLQALDAETDTLIRSVQARNQFAVTGTGLTVAVLDTGLRTTHVDFAGKVLALRNFTNDDGGNPNIVTDLNGHGTNVAGIIVGNGIHTGIAPGANVIPLKVLPNVGGGSFTWIENALDWVIANKDVYKISVVNMSLGATSNFTSDNFGFDPIQQRITTLRNAKVAVCIAAGNDFFTFGSAEGMSYPGILRQGVSVGAVYDANIGPVAYGSGAIAFTTGARRITPFSQRLHTSTDPNTRTDIFAPGAALTAAGNLTDTGSSTMHGTSQATPVVAGLCLLGQQLALKRTNALPTVDNLERWLQATTVPIGNSIFDGDDEDDNVTNTNKQYIMADAVQMLTLENSELTPPLPPPAGGIVTVNWNSASRTLTINGDDKNNVLTATWRTDRITLQSSQETKIQVGGSLTSSTTISTGKAAITITGDLKGGHDSLTIVSAPINQLTSRFGSGNDKLAVSYCKITLCKADGGADTDTFISTASTIGTNMNTSFP
jgi:hypothetical protein